MGSSIIEFGSPFLIGWYDFVVGSMFGEWADLTSWSVAFPMIGLVCLRSYSAGKSGIDSRAFNTLPRHLPTHLPG